MLGDVLPNSEPHADRLDDLVQELFVQTGVAGVYGRTGDYEAVVEALGALISAHRPSGAEIMHFPPVMSRRQLERHGYLKSFPHLLGCVSCLSGAEADIRGAVDRFENGQAWTDSLQATDLVLSPAACYPVYPLAAARGVAPAGGLAFDVACDCFRHEPSHDIDRLQSFRMREFVLIGSPDQVLAFRTGWIERASGLARQLGLSCRIESASDPFFGRGAQIVALTQKAQEQKFELLIPIRSRDAPTACMSFNYHGDHFGKTWELKTAGGRFAHTCCVAFGMDRLAVALFATHGVDVRSWPPTVRRLMEL